MEKNFIMRMLYYEFMMLFTDSSIFFSFYSFCNSVLFVILLKRK